MSRRGRFSGKRPASTKGVTGTAAHIHQGAVGKPGYVVIPLLKEGETYTVPPGAQLNGAQGAAFEAGDLFTSVHSAAHPGGEIRGQLN